MELRLWVGEHGSYLIPQELEQVVINGQPDKRDNKYQEFIEWVKSVDKPSE